MPFFRSSLLTAFISLSIWTPSTYAEPSREIVIGGLFDLTGGGAVWGRSERNAFDLACRDFEASHPGITVKGLVEDTLFSSKNTVTALQKLISINKVSYVIGATWESTVPMMPLCEARHVVCISPSYHGKEYYSRPWRYNFTAWFDDRGYTTALARAINDGGYKEVAIFAALTPYYDSLVENFTPQVQGKIVASERVVLEERDFRALLAKLPKKVDAVLMLLDNAGQIQAFLKQWSETRRDRPVIYSDDLIAYLDPPDDILRHGFTYFYSYPLFDETRLREFTTRYTARYHHAPEGSSAAVAYDETTLLLGCIMENPAVESVRDCLARTEGYNGYSGTISFGGGQTVKDRVIGVKRFGG